MAKTPAKKASRNTARKVTKKPARASKPATRTPPDREEGSSKDDLLARIVSVTGLDVAEIELRALQAFAAAHGIVAQEVASAPAPAVAPPTPAPAQPKKAAPAATTAPQPANDPNEGPALAPDVRLYVHAQGRAPSEMINDTFFIGTSPKADVRLSGPKIGAWHVKIFREGNKYFAANLADSGTVVHGEQVGDRYELHHEDDLYVGGYYRVRVYLLG